MNKTLLGIAVLAALGGLAGRASAQGAKQSAELLFEDGQRLLAQGNTAEACPKFEQSQKLDPAIGTLLNLAHCYEVAGRVTSAWATYLDAEKLARAKQDKRAKGAHDRAAELAPKIPKLVVHVASPPAGLAVTINGQPLDPSLVGAPVPEDPGAITVAASAAGYKPFSTSVQLAAGASVTVEVTMAKGEPVVTPPPPPKPPVPVIAPPPPPQPEVVPSPPPAHGHRRAIGIGVGAGGAALAIGGGALALLAKHDYDAAFSGAMPACDRATHGCTPEGAKTTADARTKANLGGAILGVGVLAVAAGAYLYLTAPDDDAPARTAYVAPVIGDGTISVVYGGSL